MELKQAIRERHSYRVFAATPVPPDVLEDLVEAAAHAPSSHNSQPVRLYVATGATRARVGEAIALTTKHLEEYVEVLGPEEYQKAVTFYADMGAAPVAVAVTVPTAEEEMSRVNDLLSAGAAIENLLLAATDAGLGACSLTVSYWVRDELADILGLTEDREVISVIVLGYPDEVPRAPEHRKDIVTYLD